MLLKKVFYRVLVLIILLSLSGWLASGCQVAEKPEGAEPPQEDDRKNNGEIPVMEFEELPSLEEILEPAHPDEPLEYTLNERFSLDNSLGRLEQIREFGYKAMDELAPGFELYMGFTNWTGVLEGTLLKQGYEIKKLQLELARCRYLMREIGERELERAEKEYDKALQEFLAFWETFAILD